MISEIDLIIRQSLKDLAEDVFASNWFGREREAVSLYAFDHLLQYCREDSVLSDPTQIAIEGAVPQIPEPNRKTLVCKDLVIWPRPGMTCWNEEREPVQYPVVMVKWQMNKTRVSSYDMGWLRKFSKEREDFVGYAVCLDLWPQARRRFGLSCTRVRLGQAHVEWLRA
jgi:hypothetical protein